MRHALPQKAGYRFDGLCHSNDSPLYSDGYGGNACLGVSGAVCCGMDCYGDIDSHTGTIWLPDCLVLD